jgi:hypothetical protein
MSSQPVIVRGVQRIVKNTTYVLERKLPATGTIYAKLRDEVKPETVIGESKVSAGFRIFRLNELLGVSPAKAKKYLHRTIGSRVYQGDIIAEAPKSFGLRQVQFISPIDGVLQHYNEQSGQLTMQFAPVTFRLPAGAHGKIVQIQPDDSAFIEMQASLLFGSFTAGKMREGTLRLVAEANEPISPQAIDSRLAGYVIAGGSIVTKDVINRALAVGVRGIVCGGIAAHDLLSISGEINSQEDVGLTLLITSGLGQMAMEESTYAFLKEHQEQHVFLVPKEKMLVAPLSPTSTISSDSELQTNTEYMKLKVGDTVRLLSSPKIGEVVTVKDILDPEQVEGSRMVLAHCLLQRQSGDTIKIPITNIEIVSS